MTEADEVAESIAKALGEETMRFIATRVEPMDAARLYAKRYVTAGGATVIDAVAMALVREAKRINGGK
jgi:hypothetical protein